VRYLLSILALAIALYSCEKERSPEDPGWSEGVLYWTGEVAVDGCDWLLLSDGESYHMAGLEPDFMINGLDVWFKGTVKDEYFTCGLDASKYKLINVEEMKKKPWKARFLSDYPDRELSLDSFSMDSVSIDGDSLRMHVGYSGGCAIHQFNLWILETGLDGKGDPHILLEHIGNGDPCEAYPWVWLSFSLEELQVLDNNRVTFWLRGSPQMSSLFGPYTYKF
jgi:hypothetical protein